jgi:SSS family solute:Na+ symporter
MTLEIGTIDLIVVAAYLLFIVSLGVWVGLRRRRQDSGSQSYFLAGGTLSWPIIGLALFSTNISTIHLVSFAQEGYVNGLAYGNFEWMAPFTLIIMSLFFAPFYIRSKVATLPDFLEMRYSRPCRDWLAVLSIVAAIFIHIGFSLYTGAVVLRGMFGIDLHLSIVVVAGLIGIYTIVGGLTAVVVTESIETVVLLLGALLITIVSYWQVGGWGGITETLQEHGELVKLTVLRSADDTSNLPWYAVFLGYPIIGIWYWCADQTIVQRVLGARDENHARVGPLFTGFIKILPVFLFVFPGLICYVLVLQGKLPNELGDTADTYAFMIHHLLPVGLKGIVAAALLAALMGTVSGALNSIATLFSYDIFKRWRPETEDRQLVKIGRTVTFLGMLAAIIWSPFIARFESIYQGIIALICYIAPPITAVFLLGVFWRRASSTAAQLTLYLGSALGLTVFVLDWFKDDTGWSVVPMMATFYLFVVCVLIMVVISTIVPHHHTPASERLVWSSPLDALKSPGWSGLGNYKFLSVLLFITMVLLYWVFA